MKQLNYFLILILLILSNPAFSQVGGKSKLFLFEINPLVGWGSSQMTGDTSTPSIGTFDLGLQLGVNIKKFSLGVSYDYRILTQFSDVDPAVGNRRGTFVSPASLFFRINFEKIKFGFLLINSGTYALTNITVTGKKIVYTDPSGFRFDLVFKKINKFEPVIFYESVAFSTMQLDGVKSAMAGNLNFSNFGAGLKYDF